MKEKQWNYFLRPIAVIMLLLLVIYNGSTQVVTVGIELLPGIEFRLLPITPTDRVDGAPSGTSRSAVRWIELTGNENIEVLLSGRETNRESRFCYMNGGSFSPDRATPLAAERCSFVLNTAVSRQKDLIRYKAWIGIADEDPGELTIVFP